MTSLTERLLFYTPDDTRTDQWITLLADEGVPFEPIVWRPGMTRSGARLAIARVPPPALFQAEPELQVLFNMGAGMDAILDIPDLPASLQLIRIEDAGMAGKMCEYAVHAVAEIVRGMGGYRTAQRNRQWQPAPYQPPGDWPVGVMGLGVIGSRIASTLASIGYPVRGWARSARTLSGIQCFRGPDQLPAFLGGSRILINVLPLTAATRHILNDGTLQQLPAGSHVINIGRGEHLDEAALQRHLDRGHLAGAVLDVFQTEPLPAGHPFWHDPRIVISPHISGSTDPRIAMRQIALNIRAFQRGAPLTGVVDRQRGY